MIEDLVKSDQVRTLDELIAKTGATTGCGKCKERIAAELAELLHIYNK